MNRLLEVAPLEGLDAPQCVLSPSILVDAASLSVDSALVESVVDFVNQAASQARLVPGEYPEEAIWCYCADYYFAQVTNGGHGQYAHNSGMRARGLRHCRAGLEAMGAHDYLAIFDEFLAHMAADPVRAQAIELSSGFGDIDPAVRALDQRFFQLEDMPHANAAWLRSLAVLKPLPAGEMAAAYAELRAKNPLFQARHSRSAAARRDAEQNDPTYSAALALASQEGATLERLTAGTPLGDIGIEWGALTSLGLRRLKIINGNHADWRDDDRTLKGRYYYATKNSYPRAVGDGVVRRELMRDTGTGDVPAQVLGEFYQRPVMESVLAIAPEGKSARCLILAASDANDLQVLPREAWRGLAVGSEHAELRLMLAYTLWDLSIAYAVSLNAKVPASDYMATALMAAAGAIAITGVCALRLPTGQQLAALAERARPDFEREQCNLCHQIVELGEWWRRSIGSISRELEKARVPKSILLRPSAYRLAGTLLFEGDERQLPAATLHRHMTYFDPEYASPGAGPAEFGRILRSTLTAFNDNPARYQILEAARYFERVEQLPGGPAVKVILRVAPPDQVGATSKSHLIGVVSLLNAASLARMGTVGVDFDRKGRRRTIGC